MLKCQCKRMFVAHNVGLLVSLSNQAHEWNHKDRTLSYRTMYFTWFLFLPSRRMKNVTVFCIRIFLILRHDIYEREFFFFLFFAPRQIINLFNHLMYAYFLISRHVIRSLTAVCFQLFQWGSFVANLKIVIVPSDLIPTKSDFFLWKLLLFHEKKITQQVQPFLSVFFLFISTSYEVIVRWTFFFLASVCMKSFESAFFFFEPNRLTNQIFKVCKGACFSEVGAHSFGLCVFLSHLILIWWCEKCCV